MTTKVAPADRDAFRRLHSRSGRFLALTFVIVSAAFPTFAADRFWDGGTTNFNTPGNWVGGALPTSSDRAVFITSSPSVVISSTISIQTALFIEPGLTISGTTLGLSNTTPTLLANNYGVTTISAPIFINATNANASFGAVMGGELVISGNISGSTGAGFQRTNYGTLTLSGTNTFTGGIGGSPNGNFGLSRLNINSDYALGTGTLTVGTGNGGTTLGNTSGLAHTLSSALALTSGGSALTHWNLDSDLTFTGVVNIAGGAGANTQVDVLKGTLTFASGLGETGLASTLTKTGMGTLVVAGNNTYTGSTTLSGGTFVVDRSAVGSAFSSTITTLTNSQFVLKGATTGSTGQTLNTASTTFSGNTGITVNGNGGTTSLSMGNTWTRSGSATLNINLQTADSSLISAPTVANSIVMGSAAAAFVTVRDTTGIGFATVSGGNVVRYTGASTLAAASNALTTNFVTKVGDPGYAGDTLTMSSGTKGVNTLQLDTTGGAGILNLNSGTLFFGSRGLLVTGNNNYTIQNGTLGALNTELVIHQFSSGTLILNGNVGGITKGGTGTVLLSGTSTASAGNVVNDGTLDVTGRIGPGGLLINGATETSRGQVNLLVASSATSGGITVQGSGILNVITAANAISGNASVRVNGGNATATLSVANNYTGGTTLDLGRLNINQANAIGSGTLALNGGLLDNTSGGTVNIATNNAITLTGFQFVGSNALNLGNGAILMNTSTNAANRLVAVHSSTLTLGGNMYVTGSGGGGLTKVGAGTLALSGSNNFTSPLTGINSGVNGTPGLVTVSGGVLLLQHNYALSGGIGATGGSAGLTIDGGVVGLGSNNFSRTIGTGTSDFQITSNGGGFAAYGANRTVDVGGAGVSSAVTWGGTGWADAANILALSTEGATGTLEWVNSINLSASGGTKDRIIRVDDGGAKIDARISGTIATGGATVTNLEKAGKGTLELTNVNTYNGSTFVGAGTLLVSGSGSINGTSSVTVANGATLAYSSSVNLTKTATFVQGSKLGGTNWNGTLDNALVSAAGGGPTYLTPGNSPGTASTGSQTWGSGGGYIWEINDFTPGGAGTTWDLINLTGSLSVTSTSLDKFNIFVTSLDAGNNPGNATNFNDLSNYQLLIADAGSAITSFNSSLFNVNTLAFGNSFTGTWSIVRGDDSAVLGGDSSQIYLLYTAVPEPSTLALIGLGAMVAVLRRRRR